MKLNRRTFVSRSSYAKALRAGEDERDLVTAVRRETLVELRRRLGLDRGRYSPHQGTRERARRLGKHDAG